METVQKMDKKSFVRVASKKYTSGFYVNMIFEAEPESITPLLKRFSLNEEVFRVLFSILPPAAPAKLAVA